MPATPQDRLYGLTTSVAVKPPVYISADYEITRFGEQTITSKTPTDERTITTTEGMRVLLLGQDNPVENGIWVARRSFWVRATDFNGPRDAVNGTLVFSINGDCWQVEADDPVVIGKSAIHFRPTYPFEANLDIFQRTLRVPEASVNVLPSADERAWKGLGFDGAGQPKLQDPAGTGLWGYVPAIGSFEKGSLLTQRFEVLLWESTDEYWRWDGAMPKIVLPGSTPDTAGGRSKGKWLDVTDATLRSNLGSDEGQLLVGAPASIAALRSIHPGDYARIETKGAFAAGDGGDGSWVYDHADLSEEVSLYPRIFIAPNDAPTGASGAWRPNIGKKLIKLAAIGFGVMGLNAAAGDTWPLQAAEAARVNKEILEQCVRWDAGQRVKEIPPVVIHTSSYSFPDIDPKLKATPATNSSNGSFFLTHPDLNTEGAPYVFDIGQLSSRMSLPALKEICCASYQFFSTPNYNTFTDAREDRICFRIRHVGTKVNIKGLYAGGYSQGYYFSELWDGVIEQCRALYCSNPQGTKPAFFIGSQESDNSNALDVHRLHIEFSPYAFEVGFCEHVNFTNGKVEAYRAAGATHPLVRLQPQCSKINITGFQFVTNNATTTHAIEDYSQFTNFNDCWFAGADDENYPQAGIHWYKRVNPNNSQTTFTNCHFNRCHVADGSDPNDYPIILGNYAVFDAICRVSSTYNTSAGTVTVVNGGILNCGTSCTVKRIHIISGSSTKAYGPTIWFSGTGNLVERVTNTAGDNIFRLAGGDANNAINSWGGKYLNTTASLIYTYGKRDVILTAATNVTQLFGFVGDIIRITSNSSGSTIVNSANLITSSGAVITMAAGVTYTFRMSSGSTARQVTA